MKFDSKIEDMVLNGRLTVDQAAVLKNSLNHSIVQQTQTEFHSRFPLKTLIISMALVFIALIITVSSGGEVTPDTQTIQNVSETLNQSGKVGEMNKSLTTVISIALICLPIIGSLIWFAASYNGLITKEENVLSSWAQVETNYQRRADLIPNLVKIVKAFADHEGATLENIISLRAKADDILKDTEIAKEATQGAATRLDDDSYIDNIDKSQIQVGLQLRTMMAMVESYPSLKSSEQFLALQAQIEGTENRISVARMLFNESVGEFNASIRRLPGSLAAGLGDFKRKAYFKSDVGTEKVVDVNFDEQKEPE